MDDPQNDIPAGVSDTLPSAQTTATANDTRLFPGFERPENKWTKLPHTLIERLPLVETVGELKVILYVLRHTWGFQEFDLPKRITLDEFQHGRKRADGSRIDGGTGVSRCALNDGIRRAVAHGFLVQELEPHRDRGRQSHVYCLRMSNTGLRVSDSDTLSAADKHPDDQPLTPTVPESDTRSEKETMERNQHRQGTEAPVICSIHNVPMKLRIGGSDQWYSHRLPNGDWCKGRPGDVLDRHSTKSAARTCRRCKYPVHERDICPHGGCRHCCRICYEPDEEKIS